MLVEGKIKYNYMTDHSAWWLTLKFDSEELSRTFGDLVVHSVNMLDEPQQFRV